MKFSVCLATGYEGLAYPIPFCEPQDLVKTAVLCEQLGYDAVWGNDHLTTQNYVRDLYGEPPNFYDVLIVMAMIAQATTRLRVGAGLLVMPMREPVMLAKQVATIDQMSGGRFMLAVGLGAYREEFQAWAGSAIRRRAAATCSTRASRRSRTCRLRRSQLSRASTTRSRGWSWRQSRCRIRSRSISVATTKHRWSAPHNMAKAGCRAGDRSTRSGNAYRSSSAGPRRLAAIPPRSKWRRNSPCCSERPTRRRWRTYMNSGLVHHRISLAYTGRDPKHQVTGNLVGSAQTVIDKIGQLKDMGVDHLAAMVVAVNSLAEYDEQCRWFAEEVMPHVR